MQFKPSLLRIAAACFAVTLVFAGQAQASATSSKEFRFRVLLNDDEIGTHNFRVSREAGDEIVEIDADFRVTFLGITVYSYDHVNRERWRNGCLDQIDSRTDDNGDKFAVDGKDRGEDFEVSTQDGQRQLDANCVMTFAYWNRDYLSQTRLLISQNGEFLEIEVEAGGLERLRFDEQQVATERYRLRNRERGIDITVWYAADTGRWLCLESRVDGRVIRYLPEGVATMARLDQPVAEKLAPRDMVDP